MFTLLSLAIIITSSFISPAFGQAAGQADTSNNTTTGACDLEAITEYDLGLHIAGVFIVFAISSIGITTAISLGTPKGLKNETIASTLQLLKFFGCGVVVSTAWVHLLSDAYSQFLNPCLQGDTFVNWGANFPGWIGLGSALIIQVIEYFAISKQYAIIDENKSDSDTKEAFAPGSDNDSPRLTEALGHSHGVLISVDEYEVATLTVGTVMLEIGVIFHSVIIGIALGIVTDEWHTLIVAICFHQLFEGMALGSRIASTNFRSFTKFLMGLAYPLTTPLGIAIGIGIRFTFNANSQTAIIVQGVFDSISAGILIYNGYVELVAVEMNHNRHFHALSNSWKFYLYAAFILGLASMSVVGLWA